MKTPDLQPILNGDTLKLRPLREDDFALLYEAASDPAIWEQHPDSARYQRDVFRKNFFRGAIDSRSALAVVENDTGRIIGSSRYYEWDPESLEIAIGYTFLERNHWGNGSNREMKALMLAHAFKYAHTVWFHVGKSNLRSRRAVEKLGATLSFEQDRELDGNRFVQLYYKLHAPQISTDKA